MSQCRICLCSKPRKNISELNVYENGKKQTYKDIIMFCLGIQITEDSNESTKLCVKCYRKIIKFYEFKLLALRNDENLRSALENGVFWFKEDKGIKIETDTEFNDLDEPILIQIKNEDDFDFDDQVIEDNIPEFKFEYKGENHSDDEFLSVIKNLKCQPVEETKENAPILKKERRFKVKKVLTPEELQLKKKNRNNRTAGICEHCGTIYKDLTAHMRLKHYPKEWKRIPCEHCDETFANNVYKRRHVQRKHLNVKHCCPLCGRSVVNLKMHMRIMHEKDSLPYKCVHCGSKFLTQARLRMHQSIHTKDRPFECNICGSNFRLKISLTNHTRTVHNKERSHLCQFCSKSFFKKAHLIIHLRSHTKEKPYPCPDCGKFYQTSTSLKNHLLIHRAEKKVNCTMCDATFINKNYLNNHMISHTKEKRYPCQYCTVRFHRSDHRKRHEYTAHLKHTGSVVAAPRSYTPNKSTGAAAAAVAVTVEPTTKLYEEVCEESTASTAPTV